MQSFEVNTLADLTAVADTIIAQSGDYPIILLNAEMGAGKTTLVNTIMKQLDFEGTSSPTFSIVNQYDTSQGTWYHFDLYRIEEPEGLLDIGFEEYLSSGCPCLIEWPQVAEALIDSRALLVSIEVNAKQRLVTISTRD